MIELDENAQKFLLVFLGAFLLLVLIEGGLRAAGSINSAWQKNKNRSLFQRQDVIRIMCIGESTTYVWISDFQANIRKSDICNNNLC